MYNISFDSAPASMILFAGIIIYGGYTLFFRQDWIEKSVLLPYEVVRKNAWYQIVTSHFAHANLAHWFFNLITFYYFAIPLELTVGSFSFLMIYVGSLLVSDAVDIFRHKNNPHFATLGASGAISGALFSFVVFYPFSNLYIFLIPIGIPAIVFAPLFLVISSLGARRGWGRINHDAHFWGAVSGFFITIFLFPKSFSDLLTQIISIFN